jgi:ParB family chromosome partitioning protein
MTKLKGRGLISPYLRDFVISRINPLHWIQGGLPQEAALKTMIARAHKFNIKKSNDKIWRISRDRRIAVRDARK